MTEPLIYVGTTAKQGYCVISQESEDIHHPNVLNYLCKCVYIKFRLDLNTL